MHKAQRCPALKIYLVLFFFEKKKGKERTAKTKLITQTRKQQWNLKKLVHPTWIVYDSLVSVGSDPA